MVVDGRMGGGKFLEASHTPETEHCVFSSPERQVGILRTIVRVIWPICRYGMGARINLGLSATGHWETRSFKLRASFRSRSPIGCGWIRRNRAGGKRSPSHDCSLKASGPGSVGEYGLPATRRRSPTRSKATSRRHGDHPSDHLRGPSTRVIWPICRHSAGSTSILPAITTGKHRRTLGPDQFRPLRTRAHNSAAAA